MADLAAATASEAPPKLIAKVENEVVVCRMVWHVRVKGMRSPNLNRPRRRRCAYLFDMSIAQCADIPGVVGEGQTGLGPTDRYERE
jgi:hypothetical protein